MIAKRYSIYSFTAYDYIYLTHFGRLGSTGNYTFFALSKEKCNMIVTTGTTSISLKITQVNVTIGDFYFTYVMPEKKELYIDLSDVVSINAGKILNVSVEVVGTTTETYSFKINVAEGYDIARMLRAMSLCREYYKMGANGNEDVYFIGIPDEPIMPITQDGERKFTKLTIIYYNFWSTYGTNNFDILQDGVDIGSYQGDSSRMGIYLENVKKNTTWELKAVGSSQKICNTRAMSDKGVFITGKCPFPPRLTTSTKNYTTYDFGFFFDIIEFENNATQTNLIPDAVAMPYLIETQMRIKVGIKNISVNDFILYSNFIKMCENLQVFFDNDGNASGSQTGYKEGYNARLVNADFVMPIGDTRQDFIVELIIAY
jgi:hypothetical protein